jgi:uncharacterized protein YkwD
MEGGPLLLQLQEMFPDLPSTTILAVTESLPSQDNATEELIERLLSIQNDYYTPKQAKEEEDKTVKVSQNPTVYSIDEEEEEGADVGTPRKRPLLVIDLEDDEEGEEGRDESGIHCHPYRNLEEKIPKNKKTKVGDLFQLQADSKLAMALQRQEEESLSDSPRPGSISVSSSQESEPTTALQEQLDQVRREREKDWKQSQKKHGSRQEKGKNEEGGGHKGFNVNIWRQMKGIRERHKQKWIKAKSTSNARLNATMPITSNTSTSSTSLPRIRTLSDVEKGSSGEEPPVQLMQPPITTVWSNAKYEQIGRKCLEKTNEYRKQNGLPPLKWSDALHQVAITHSQAMAEKKVKFGHDGFRDRMRMIPYRYRTVAENVAMNYGVRGTAHVAVKGWVNSPGHRKNLLSSSEFCAIGVWRNMRGQYYLTQLFTG